MYRFLALVVPVDNQVKGVARLGLQRDKLLAAGGAEIINQRQVPVRGQGGAAAN